MKIGKTLYVTGRAEWRSWLQHNHNTAKEIWLIYYKKSSGKPRIPYNDSVEEALCYGWIDSTVKSIDKDSFAQRFSPRRPTSQLSEMNKERIRRLIKEKKMTAAGLKAIEHVFNPETDGEFTFPEDILQAIKKDATAWKNFRNFPESYRQIRIGWIEGARIRPEEFSKRLQFFLKKTRENKRFGMVQ